MSREEEAYYEYLLAQEEDEYRKRCEEAYYNPNPCEYERGDTLRYITCPQCWEDFDPQEYERGSLGFGDCTGRGTEATR